MGSQLRFDPSFFGLALRASAEADALFFSDHKDLSITRCPTRAGLRLTSPAKASGEWGKAGGSVRHQKGSSYCIKKGSHCIKRADFYAEKEARASRRSNGARVGK